MSKRTLKKGELLPTALPALLDGFTLLTKIASEPLYADDESWAEDVIGTAKDIEDEIKKAHKELDKREKV